MWEIFKIANKIWTSWRKSWKNRNQYSRRMIKTTVDKIQKGIFQKESFTLILYIIAMTPLNYTLRKFTWSYTFTKSQENIKHVPFMNDIKIFVKNERTRNTYTYDNKKQPWYRREVGIEHFPMMIISKRSNWRNRNTTLGKPQNSLRKRKFLVTGNNEKWST